MKTLKVLSISALAAAGLLLASGATAQADADTFLNDAHAAGFFNGDGNLAMIGVGESVCSDMAKGTSPSDEAHALWIISGMTDQDTAQQFVDIAVKDLCPPQGT